MIERVTIVVNSETKDKIVSHYSPIQKENKGEYILFFAQNSNVTVTIYNSKKNDKFKVFFIVKRKLRIFKFFYKNFT